VRCGGVESEVVVTLQTPRAKFGSFLEAVEGIFDEDWSDGLPVVPATEEAVEAMLRAGGRAASDVLGTLVERERSLEVAQAAVCAVMAGCRPESFPVVLATWDTLFDDRLKLHGVLSSTGGPAFAAVVSGPHAEQIGMNSGAGLFSPGNRPNATIGRAIRLGAMSALDAIPGVMDASSYGHGGRYSFHFAEAPPPPGWETLREQLGYPLDATTVTVMPAEAPRQVMHRWRPSASDLLNTLAASMRDPSQNATGTGTCYMVVLGPEHAQILCDSGITKSDVSEALSDLSRIDVDDIVRSGKRLDADGSYYLEPDADNRIMSAPPEHILVVTAGGPGAGWSAMIPMWTRSVSYAPSTRPVHVPGAEVVERIAKQGQPDFA
jgi:hypothetical protein